MVVENAFGRLKGRWRCLLKRLDINLKNVPAVVASCVVLHNLCEMFGDTFREEWDSVDTSQEISLSANSTGTVRSPRAAAIWDTIKDYIYQ